MNQRNFDIIVVSAFGRGHWAAVELAGEGFSVALIDVSESLGRWTPDDWEGPFGLFNEENWGSSKLARLTEEDYMDPIPQGLTVWLPNGPMETQGPMSHHWFGPGAPLEWQKNWILDFVKSDQTTQSKKIKELLKKPFLECWWIYFSFQLAAPVYLPNAQALEHGLPLQVFSPFFVRRVSRRGFQQSLDWCEKNGVTVRSSATLQDVVPEGKSLAGIEVAGELSGAIQAKKYLWCLTSVETEKVLPKTFEKLFPDGVLKPEWSWVRSRWSWDLHDYDMVLPQHLIFLSDLGLPWAHENMIVMQKTVKPGVWDFWVRIPDHQRFQRAYIETLLQRMEQLVRARAPQFELKVLEKNQEDLYDYQQLGPARFPVYDPARLKDFPGIQLQNVRASSPEQWTLMDWAGRMLRDQQIVEEWLEWRRQQIEKQQRKGGSSDQTIHPS